MRHSSSILFFLASCVVGCGARSTLTSGVASDGAAGGSPSDPPAHIYVAEAAADGPNRIVRIDDMTGKGYTTFGEGIFAPTCTVALDSQDRIYTVQFAPPSVRRIDDMTGKGLIAFEGPSGMLGFGTPSGVAIDSSDRVYIVDGALHRIVRVDDLSGTGWVTLGGPDAGSGVGQFDFPAGIAVSAEGKILVGDSGNRRIVIMDDISGAGWQERSLGPSSFPYGVSFDREGRIYAVDFDSSILHRFTSITGAEDATLVSSPSLPLFQMSHVFVHDSGRIFLGLLNVAPEIVAIDDMSGKNLVRFGGAGSPAGQKLWNPCGVFAR